MLIICKFYEVLNSYWKQASNIIFHDEHIQRNIVFSANSDFLILKSLQPNVRLLIFLIKNSLRSNKFDTSTVYRSKWPWSKTMVNQNVTRHGQQILKVGHYTSLKQFFVNLGCSSDGYNCITSVLRYFGPTLTWFFSSLELLLVRFRKKSLCIRPSVLQMHALL